MSIAKRVIDKCGGIAKTAELVGRHPSWVTRWTYEKTRGGTGGTVPRKSQERLLEAAQRGEVDITPDDFFDVAERAQ